VLRCTIDPEVGSMLVDRTQIGQVLFNLIRNAAEAIQDARLADDRASHPTPAPLGQIIVSAQINSDSAIWIEVRDNGPGLAPGIAERLFEPFVSTKRTGMGIGLAICRTIVEGHGGMLIALPNPDGGLVFRISLPASLPPGVAA
jgi:two-component system sensor kinase FixL